MPEPGWKKFESRVARWWTDGRRRGAATSGDGAGRDDCLNTDAYSVEATLQHRIGFSVLLDKCHQAEKNAAPGKIPLVVAKTSNLHDENALVVMRADTFRDHFLHRGADGDPAMEEEF